MIRQVVAMDEKQGIAKNGSQPWKLPKEAAHFHALTKSKGGVVLMGRTTFELIGIMDDRDNYVLTSRTAPIAGVTLVHDLDSFLAGLTTDLWIIGGAKLYETTLGLADELHITKIATDFGCDSFYPPYEASFKLVSATGQPPENGLSYAFYVYRPRGYDE